MFFQRPRMIFKIASPPPLVLCRFRVLYLSLLPNTPVAVAVEGRQLPPPPPRVRHRHRQQVPRRHPAAVQARPWALHDDGEQSRQRWRAPPRAMVSSTRLPASTPRTAARPPRRAPGICRGWNLRTACRRRRRHMHTPIMYGTFCDVRGGEPERAETRTC